MGVLEFRTLLGLTAYPLAGSEVKSKGTVAGTSPSRPNSKPLGFRLTTTVSARLEGGEGAGLGGRGEGWHGGTERHLGKCSS